MDAARDAVPIVIYGAGSAGQELCQAILMDKSKKLIAFYDDSKNLKDRSKNGIPIYGSLDNLKKLKKDYQNIEVLLAIPSLDIKKRRKVISKLEELKIAVRTVPALHELIFDSKKMSDIQNLSMNDILPGRRVEKYSVVNAHEREFFISGAGGSIGAELTRQILSQNPKKIILFDLSEFNLFNIFEESKLVIKENNFQTLLIPMLGNVCDQNHLNHIFKNHNIDTVYHAAAYKHVPLVEDENNIAKSIENNLLGTYLIAKTAIKAKIKSFVLVSTDKAVRPTNIMGATKRMAEISIQALNQSQNDTNLCMVRFGNVINSSGSVIPLFLDQISRGGPITITHKQVERYFMTIPEASSLVIQAGEMSVGGEVFVLDMGEQIKIFDLAKKLIHLSGRNIANNSNISGIEIVEVGLRPGEKMYEELLISGESQKTPNDKIFKSNEMFIVLKEFTEVVEDVKCFVKDNEVKKLKNIMSKYVDGFVA
jgi:FlaA1/EpsC-like NDP-sugar epimerase